MHIATRNGLQGAELALPGSVRDRVGPIPRMAEAQAAIGNAMFGNPADTPISGAW
ncbi:hypothetical protein ACFV6G_10035 [Streptomyces lavendulae]|uniref:hypothetical protein n=1 Tax=Streptomyces lavendulae TaxID=1914 RepID=UPI0036ACA68B